MSNPKKVVLALVVLVVAVCLLKWWWNYSENKSATEKAAGQQNLEAKLVEERAAKERLEGELAEVKKAKDKAEKAQKEAEAQIALPPELKKAKDKADLLYYLREQESKLQAKRLEDPVAAYNEKWVKVTGALNMVNTSKAYKNWTDTISRNHKEGRINAVQRKEQQDVADTWKRDRDAEIPSSTAENRQENMLNEELQKLIVDALR